ncbi:MAG TPA: hypothetical protein V6D29_04580 [Leptolyngbyaceae cyanobacterium]
MSLGERPFFSSPLDIHAVLGALSTDGAISVPLLSEAARQALVQEAERFYYEPEVETYGTGDQTVRTEYSSCNEFAKVGLYADFQQAFQELLDQELSQLDVYPFNTKLQFNDLVLQRYTPGQVGITPHRDSLWAIHLIALVNLCGEADFYRCDDRQGSNAVQLDTTPGNVIFLRAPGFLNTQVRPFHFLTGIRSTRYSLGLRQRAEVAVNKE